MRRTVTVMNVVNKVENLLEAFMHTKDTRSAPLNGQDRFVVHCILENKKKLNSPTRPTRSAWTHALRNSFSNFLRIEFRSFALAILWRSATEPWVVRTGIEPIATNHNQLKIHSNPRRNRLFSVVQWKETYFFIILRATFRATLTDSRKYLCACLMLTTGEHQDVFALAELSTLITCVMLCSFGTLLYVLIGFIPTTSMRDICRGVYSARRGGE